MLVFKLALIQMRVSDQKSLNNSRAETMIVEAAKQGADVIVLPEMFNTPYDNKRFRDCSEAEGAETYQMLSRLSKKLNVHIIGGSIPESDGDQIFNTSYSFNEDGDQIGKHRKMHLFDVNIPGGLRFKESKYIGAGDKITVFDTKHCRTGVAICYDVRFPELMRLMALQGAEVLIVPAAFNMTTGPVHWHQLAKMRAVDNQCFFVFVSPARDQESKYVAYGHSIVVDPWGNIVAEASDKEMILYADIDLDLVEKYRNELPLLKGLRDDIYEIIVKQ